MPAELSPGNTGPGRFVAISILLLVVWLADNVSGSSQEKTVESALRDVNYTAIDLVINSMNTFELVARINGSDEVFLLLNLKATQTLLNTEILDFLGISYREVGQRSMQDGDIGKTYLARTDSIRIGAAKIGQEELLCVNFSENPILENFTVAGILGRDFLLRHRAILDLGNNKLYLRM